MRTFLLCSFAFAAAACAAPAPFPRDSGHYAEMVPESGRIEIGLRADGSIGEVEFHISPEQLPPAVLVAARAELGTLVAAEIEWEEGVLYYEATGLAANGLELEAMFTPAGALHSFELAVGRAAMPAAVVATAEAWRGAGTVTSWEEIRDGARVLREYHVKKIAGGKRYKLIFGLDGALLRAVRETPAEVEVVVE